MAKLKESQSVVPRLRFPGFAGEWEICDLGRKTVKVGSGITPTGGQQVYKTSGRPFIRSQNIGWGELLLDDVAFIDEQMHASFSSTELVDQDVLLNITGASIGRSAMADPRVAGGNVNQHVCIIRPTADSLNPVFLNQFLISEYGQSQIDSFQAGGNRQGLNFAQIRSLIIPLPKKMAEQRRVSACLSSLDACISAESHKLDTLKAHKQSLIQLLFPAEGQRVPRLRFPGFKGEWKEAKAGKLFSNRLEMGEEGLPIFAVTMNSGMVLRSSVERRVDDIAKAEGNRKVHKGDIAYNMMRMWQGACGVAPETCMVSPAYVVLMPGPSTCSDFFGYLLKMPSMLKQLTSHSQGLTKDRLRLYYKDFITITMVCPTLGEQKKIAGCLASVDALIAVQSRRVAKLQLHKKGLTQDLFPVMEANA